MAEDSPAARVPASIAAAWGLRDRPTKGPKPGLSIERIVAAAVQVASAEGIGAVSMSRVATEMGASTMSLYRYVAAKDELLALMMDAPLTPPPLPQAGEGWRAGLERWARAERGVLLAHPWILHIPISAPPVTPNQIAWLEAGLRCLAGTGLPPGARMSVIILLSGFVWREATLTSDMMAAAKAAESMALPLPSYGTFLAGVIDEHRFPALSEVIASGELNQEGDVDGEFTFGLTRVLDGIEALIEAQSR